MKISDNYYGHTNSNRKQTDMLKGSVKMSVNAVYDLIENIKFHTATSSSYKLLTDLIIFVHIKIHKTTRQLNNLSSYKLRLFFYFIYDRVQYSITSSIMHLKIPWVVLTKM